MNLTTLDITFTIAGPVLTRDSGPAAFGCDAAMARDGEKLIIPRTLFKGRLREAMEELRPFASPALFPATDEDLFGERAGSAERGEQNSGNKPKRGRLEFGDIELTGDGRAGARHRIMIEETLGSVKKGALLVAEDAFGSGAQITGKTVISFFSEDDGKAIAAQLEKALRWIPQFGAGRTSGFGRVTSVAVTTRHTTIEEQTLDAAPAALALEITPLSPFCFAQHKIGGNFFESQPLIPGNAIKGALAEMCRAMGRPLPTRFDDIRIRHAFPSRGEKRARIAPLSIVAVKQKVEGGEPETKLFDVAARKTAILLPGEHGLTAPAFRVDWKPSVFGKCDEAFGWRQPDTTLRVRTAMDSEKRRGKDSALFSQEMIVPGTTKWRSVVDLSGIKDTDERKRAADELKTLFGAGLRFLGKTKAGADVTPTPLTAPETAPPLAKGDHIRVTLQTPALLADPRFQSGSLHDCYAAAWEELSRPEKDAPPSLALSHFFASQSLAGGNYLWQRFQRGSPKPGYRPWFLTDAGSVFILEVKDPAAAQKKLDHWLAHGLALPGWAVDEFTDDWQHNPYIPQNGFGEIAINITGEGIEEPREGEFTHV